MAKKNFYAVKYGYDTLNNQKIENKIFTNWNETALVVQGISMSKHGVAPEYKGFVNLEEAEAFLLSEKPYKIKGIDKLPIDSLHCYIDGSYSRERENYSFGLVAVFEDNVINWSKGIGTNKDAIVQQQIAGELLGAMNALLLTKELGYKKVVLFFDYMGICLHAIDYWERDTKFSEAYYKWMQRFFRNNPDIEIVFCKVHAHTGDEFNEIADGLAKAALNIQPSSISISYAAKHGILIDK